MGKVLLSLWAASMALLLISCNKDDVHGHLKEDTNVANLHPGTSTKDDTVKLLGSPSSEASFGPPTWYYISSVKRNHSLIAPELTDQHVTEIAFDASGVITSIKEYTFADGKKVDMETRITPSEGQTLGFFEQIVANLGRFNKDNTGGASNTHGNQGGTGVPGMPPIR